MATMGFCGLKPLFCGRKSFAFEEMKGLNMAKNSKASKDQKKGSREESRKYSIVGGEQLIIMMDVQKKILAFRDILDLPPPRTPASLHEIVIRTLKNLERLYPEIIPSNKVSEIKSKSTEKILAYFCKALRSLGESWMNDSPYKRSFEFPSCKDYTNMRHLGETLLGTLESLIMMGSERFDTMEEDDQKSTKDSIASTSFSETTFSCGSPPVTPTSVLPDATLKYGGAGDSPRTSSCASPLLWSLRLQAVGKLNPIDIKRLSFHSPPHAELESPKAKTEQKSVTESESNNDDNIVEVDQEKNSLEDLDLDLGTTDQESHNVINADHVETVAQMVPPPPPPPPPPLSTVVPLPSAAPFPPPAPIPLPPPPPPPPSAPHLQQKLTPLVVPPPPPPSSAPHLQQNLPPPPPPPPPQPSAVPHLQQNVAAVSVPPHPPVPLPQGSSLVGAAPPQQPPGPSKGGGAPAPPPPGLLHGNGGCPPPPPPGGAGRILRPKATTKLKRSAHLGNLYRMLKGKVEGSSLNGKSGRRLGNGQSNGGKQGLADALAEMTRRSSYFQQIEEDVQKYSKQITELRSTISNFKTKEMTELVKFNRAVESVLENLTDESQVLSRFEGFPTKKLEAIRTAASLYKKLDSIVTELQNWNIVPPAAQLLDKVERYFNKIKTEMDALERTKDNESKKFKSHNIEFDFHILIKIKEAMVDVSSSCMELALKERREGSGNGKMLWRAFQFAYRVYTFAGGHDDRADMLTRELAREIESNPIDT